MIAADFAVRRIGLLATLAGPAPRTGAAMSDLGLARDAAIAVAGDRVAWVGPDAGFGAAVALRPGAETLDAAGAAVVPGLVDPHTHLAFAGDRDDEIRRRLAGASYQEIAAEGGGIVRTVEATRAASVGELTDLVASRLDEMLLCGTTTAEVKSGYGSSGAGGAPHAQDYASPGAFRCATGAFAEQEGQEAVGGRSSQACTHNSSERTSCDFSA